MRLRVLAIVVAVACGARPAVRVTGTVREASLAFISSEEDECSQTLAIGHSAGVVRLEWTPEGDARLIVREAANYVGVTKASNRVETNASCTEAVFVGRAHATGEGTRVVFDRVETDWHWSGTSARARRGPARPSQLQLICKGGALVSECRASGAPETLALPASTAWRFGRRLDIERLDGIESVRDDDRPLGAAELASIRRCYP